MEYTVLVNEPYACDWCHEPFELSDSVGFLRANRIWYSYHRLKDCYENAKRAVQGELPIK